MSTRILVCDPPAGWLYGFPKKYDIKVNESHREWLIRNGYPEDKIENYVLTHSRFWEAEDERGS